MWLRRPRHLQEFHLFKFEMNLIDLFGELDKQMLKGDELDGFYGKLDKQGDLDECHDVGNRTNLMMIKYVTTHIK